MADRVFCIDFGSSFTKIALRRDPSANAELLNWGNIDFCVPSAIAVDRRGSKPKVAFGEEAANLIDGSGITVYRDWKKDVFAVTNPARITQSPLELLLQSDDLRTLATNYGVPHGQLEYLQQLVSTARSLIAGPGGRVVSAEAQNQTVATALAAHYFHWLRQRVMEACAKLPTTGLKYEDIPVRVAVPAFALDAEHQHPGCKMILDALDKAGWPLHSEQALVAEPYSNVIGILTKATNPISRNGKLHFGKMFSDGPLLTVLKDTEHYSSYRALVIDIGSFTTDFAALTLKPEPGTTPELTPDRGFAVDQRSVRFAVSNLDEKMRDILRVHEWPSKPDWTSWVAVQRSVYTERKGYRVPGMGKPIGGAADSEAVQSCLAEFANKLREETMAFCASLEPAVKQELILTGGGSFIPAVRDALREAAQASGVGFVKTHAPDLKRNQSETPIDKLSPEFTRGGSALGGASIYFERSYY